MVTIPSLTVTWICSLLTPGTWALTTTVSFVSATSTAGAVMDSPKRSGLPSKNDASTRFTSRWSVARLADGSHCISAIALLLCPLGCPHVDTTRMVASRTPLLRLGRRHVPLSVQKPCQGHKPRRAHLTDTMSSPGAHIVPCCDNVSA